MNFTAMLKSACIKGQDFVIQNTWTFLCSYELKVSSFIPH